jgi:hypothetical protein
MPLSEPAAREPIHHRDVACRGFRRADGLWDIEGHLRDTKHYRFNTTYRGDLEPGTPIHDMWLRLTIDDSYTVRAVEAVTEQGPFPVCGDIAPAFQALVGLRIGQGWRKEIAERLGGVKGCTHLVELLGPLATTAFQTIAPIKMRERSSGTGPATPGDDNGLIDSCHAFRRDGPVVKRIWPHRYSGPDAA